MGWTTPRDYVANEVLTAAILNVDHRDNLDVLSGHGHSGAAGMGSSSLANLVKATFTDASAPSAPGSGLTVLYTVSGRPHYRAGSSGSDTTLAILADVHAQTHASAHEPGGADTMAVDAATSTASLRTLGSGSTQGAAGNHTHTAVQDVAGASEVNTDDSAAIPLATCHNSGSVASGSWATVATKTISPTVSARIWAGGYLVVQGISLTNATLDAELVIDGDVVDSETLCSSESGTPVLTAALAGDNDVSSGSRVVYMRVRLAASGGDPPAPMEIDVAGGLGCGAMKGQ